MSKSHTDSTITRREAEVASILLAIGEDGASTADVARRLDLSMTASAPLQEALAVLTHEGLLGVENEGEFRVSERGKDWLAEILSRK